MRDAMDTHKCSPLPTVGTGVVFLPITALRAAVILLGGLVWREGAPRITGRLLKTGLILIQKSCESVRSKTNKCKCDAPTLHI